MVVDIRDEKNVADAVAAAVKGTVFCNWALILSWIRLVQVNKGASHCNLRYIYRVSSKKDFFYHSNGHNSLSIYIYCFSFYQLWFLYHLRCSPKTNGSFFSTGSTILQHTWNDFTTWNGFSEDRYLEKWSLERSDFYSMTSSQKNHIMSVMKNHTPEIDKSLTI